MPSAYETELRQKAESFLAALKNAGHNAKIDESSLREYSLALNIGETIATIYYSPKRKQHSLKPDSLPKAIRAVWDSLSANKKASTAAKSAKTAYQAYVDGSYHAGRKTVGYGAVILKDGEELTRLLGRVEEYTESRQVGGELAATMRVINWCQQNKVSAIDIYYDYRGIEAWARGSWKTEKEMTQAYAKFMKASGINVHWHKVESHTGDYWNDVADELAKEGALR
jgi:ribonuclease H-related protein